MPVLSHNSQNWTEKTWCPQASMLHLLQWASPGKGPRDTRKEKKYDLIWLLQETIVLVFWGETYLLQGYQAFSRNSWLSWMDLIQQIQPSVSFDWTHLSLYRCPYSWMRSRAGDLELSQIWHCPPCCIAILLAQGKLMLMNNPPPPCPSLLKCAVRKKTCFHWMKQV